MDVLTVKLTSVQALGLAAFGVVMGRGLKRKIHILDRLNIPDSIAGGMVYALMALFLRDRYLNVDFDMFLRDVLMVGFFTTVGMMASLRLLRLGGVQVAIFLGAAVFGLVVQIAVGSTIARFLGLHPLIGVIAGPVSLAGGPATALAFGGTFESVGIEGAVALGIACAVFGIAVGGLMGGFVGGHLIRKHKLKPAGEDGSGIPVEFVKKKEPGSSLMTNVIAIGIAMAVGSLISARFEAMGLTLPSYIGAMIAAGILRNFDDAFGFVRISEQRMEELGGVALELFIVMALLTLRLWELASLALPVLGILLVQTAILMLICWLAIFRLMGRDHEAAVMAGGYFGFMSGTTANALACMGELTSKFGAAPRAFFVVSLVGAFLIDFLNALCITNAINLMK
jgi:glutamate:Na+ symporter, ESS family